MSFYKIRHIKNWIFFDVLSMKVPGYKDLDVKFICFKRYKEHIISLRWEFQINVLARSYEIQHFFLRNNSSETKDTFLRHKRLQNLCRNKYKGTFIEKPQYVTCALVMLKICVNEIRTCPKSNMSLLRQKDEK